MFVGRVRELQKLEEAYHKDTFEFAVFYGRRRIGKTTLIRHFLQGKDAIYYMAVEGTAQDNLNGLSRAVLSQTAPGITAPVFQDFASLLNYIDSICQTRRIILAIDEYPYLAASCPAVSSMLQSHIDQCWKDSRLFLILCGSSMSFMETQVLGSKSPLYGRRTSQFKIRPFTYLESKAMLGGFTDTQQAILYGVTGGVPEYLSRISPDLSPDDNIVNLFFDESGRLYEEPPNLLKQELRAPATYQSIISAIAGGASRLNEIATATGLETSSSSSQLASLISIGLVRKETPVNESASSRRTLYRLADNMFLFWYRFVRPNLSSIAGGRGKDFYYMAVRPQIDSFMGSIFEEICRQYLFRTDIYPSLPFPPGEVGRWWGTNPVKKCPEEIDLMSVHGRSALFGECKWRGEKADVLAVESLLERGELFAYQNKWYIFFSKSGYPDAVYDHFRENPRIRLVTFEEMNRIPEDPAPVVPATERSRDD